MKLLRYGAGYSRREFLARLGTGAGAGLLLPLWPTIAATGDIARAYPDELLSIEGYTRGRISTGHVTLHIFISISIDQYFSA